MAIATGSPTAEHLPSEPAPAAQQTPVPTAVDRYGLRRKLFRREEVNEMLKAGIFAGQRFELIDGELIDKMGQGPDHSIGIRLLMAALLKTYPANRLSIQSPIEAGSADMEWNQPEPDLAVLSEAAAQIRGRHPFGHELEMVIEVADTSLRKDLTRKREIYAAAGVPEYRVLDIDARRLLIFRDLRDGNYQQELVLSESETVPGLNTTVASLLG